MIPSDTWEKIRLLLHEVRDYTFDARWFTSLDIILAVGTSHTSDTAMKSPKEDILSEPAKDHRVQGKYRPRSRLFTASFNVSHLVPWRRPWPGGWDPSSYHAPCTLWLPPQSEELPLQHLNEREKTQLVSERSIVSREIGKSHICVMLFVLYLQGWRVWRRWLQPYRGPCVTLEPAARRSEHHRGWWSRGNHWPLRGCNTSDKSCWAIISFMFHNDYFIAIIPVCGYKVYLWEEEQAAGCKVGQVLGEGSCHNAEAAGKPRHCTAHESSPIWPRRTVLCAWRPGDNYRIYLCMRG